MVTQSRHVKTGNTWNTMNNDEPWFYHISSMILSMDNLHFSRQMVWDGLNWLNWLNGGWSFHINIYQPRISYWRPWRPWCDYGKVNMSGLKHKQWKTKHVYHEIELRPIGRHMGMVHTSWNHRVGSYQWSIDSQLVIFCASSLAWHLGGKLWGAWVRSLSEKPHQDPCT